MKDPKPLLSEGASDFERQLLSAVRRERPSPVLRSRMRHTLGLTGPVAWAGSAKAMLSAFVGKGTLSVAVAGLAAAGVVGIGSLQSQRDTTSAVREVAPVAALTSAAPPVTAPLPAALPVAPPDVAPALQKQVSPADQTVGNRELREEILLLDQVRAALQSGSSARALAQLDAYQERFPSGILSREAAQLRLQAGTSPRAHAKKTRAARAH